MRSLDSLFARLFGIFLAAIVLAHLLAFAWFRHYGPGDPHGPPPPPPRHSSDAAPPFGPGHPPPPEGWREDEPFFAGPLVPLITQLVALVIAAWIGAKLLSRPIRQVSEAAERLSEDLDSPPLPEAGPREVRQAARTFNRMQARIREQVRQRSRILTAVSHDLRTPLARFKLRVEEVADDTLRTRLTQDVGEMAGMLEATLAYLREQRASEALQLLDLQSLVESLAENAQESGARIQVTGHCAPLRAQPLALRSCLNNLLDNALRYAGEVRIELEDGEHGVQVRIRDNGPGIPEALREQVFEPFYRIEGSRNRNSGGIGLGLTIARDAAHRQGGELLLSETPGGGLTATLQLPRL
jgi:signal transduction histidine kinase